MQRLVTAFALGQALLLAQPITVFHRLKPICCDRRAVGAACPLLDLTHAEAGVKVPEFSQRHELGGNRERPADSPRVLRSGSSDVRASYVRSSTRVVYFPMDWSYTFGFRPARTLPPGRVLQRNAAQR